MHQKYAKDGFAAISVSLDDPGDPQAKARVVKFLEGQKAAFTNLILDEQPEVWQEKLKFAGPPAVFVFDRQGKWKKFEGDFQYKDVEAYVQELLKK